MSDTLKEMIKLENFMEEQMSKENVTQPVAYCTDFEEYVSHIIESARQMGIALLGKRELEYGVQLVFEDKEYNVLKLNVYKSKKGFTHVPSDRMSGIYKRLASVIGGWYAPCEISNVSCIGSDESGKGDYFGPLVVAGMASDKQTDKEMQVIGVRDSKNLSDKQVREISDELIKKYPSRIRIMNLEPETYNAMYSKCLVRGKKLNSLLGYAHGNVITDLIRQFPETELVIADQFGDQSYITDEISNAGCREIKIVPRAEKYYSVAAASILARSQVLKWNEDMSQALEMKLPKGCGSDVITCASELVKKFGAEQLKKFVKIHFKTTDTVMRRSL